MVRIVENSFRFSTTPGKSIRTELHIESDGTERVKGQLFSDHIRIVPESENFSGKYMQLRFGIDVTGLSPGEHVSGNLIVVTDAGEKMIPVLTEIRNDSGRGPEALSTLDAFAERARRNPAEAFALFLSPAFPDLIRTDCTAQLPDGLKDAAERQAALHYSAADNGIDRVRGDSRLLSRGTNRTARLLALYKGLSVPSCGKTGMEEFLLAAGLKAPVEITPVLNETEYFKLTDSVRKTVGLRKNGWGSFVISAEAEGDFLELPQKTLTEEDFVGSTCQFDFIIRRERLGSGKHFGKLIFHLPNGLKEIRITASAAAKQKTLPAAEADRLEITISELLLDRMMDKIDDIELEKQAQPHLERLMELRPEDHAKQTFLSAWLCERAGRHSDAATLIRELTEREMNGCSEAVRLARTYLELLTGLLRIKPEEYSRQLEKALTRNPDQVLLFLLLQAASPELARYPRKRLKMQKALYQSGCRSPFLYAAVLRDLLADDTRLKQLDDFHLQVLLFGARRELLSRNLVVCTAYLASNAPEFNQILFRILAAGYKAFPSDGILEAIVRLLMKGKPGDRRCFPWFEKAVKHNLRVLGLYEYYAEALPQTGVTVLPDVIRRYFLYQSSVSEDACAALYAAVVRNREQDPETFEEYKKQMTSFAQEELHKGRLTENCAALYQALELIPTDEISGRNLTSAIFSERICCDDPQIRRAVVIHPGIIAESHYPFCDGSTYICRASEDAAVLLEDHAGRRYAVSCDYSITPMMQAKHLRENCRNICPQDPGLLLSAAEDFQKQKIEDADSFRTWKRIAAHSSFEPAFRDEARRWVLHYILLHPENSIFTANSNERILNEFAEADRASLVQILLRAGLYRHAFRILVRCGTEGTAPAVLRELTEHMIDEGGGAFDSELLFLTDQVFRNGEYGDSVLQYLSEYFEGSLAHMLEIRKACCTAAVSTFCLDEKILRRLVLIGENAEEGPSVFRSYLEEDGNRRLLHAYLEFYCGDVLGTSRLIDPYLAHYIAERIEEGEPVDFAMKLAFLKHIAQKQSPNVQEEILTERLLEESMKRGLRFGFYQQLPDSFVRRYMLEDRVFIEQKADPAAEVYLHYRTGSESRMHTVSLARRFRNIFSREFTLFYGEELTYYISIEKDGHVEETPEKTIRCTRVDLTGTNSYQRINRMLAAREQGDYESLAVQMRDYQTAKKQAEILFPMKGGHELL
ncbi:MAG: DUF5717 family protein [Lachnospiraceae bacterium]|nr:DUF5717 family protein [Lachnospiraceae bacterium]